MDKHTITILSEAETVYVPDYFQNAKHLNRIHHEKLMVTGVQIPTPSRQQVGPFVHYDGFSTNNMRLNSSQFGTF